MMYFRFDDFANITPEFSGKGSILNQVLLAQEWMNEYVKPEKFYRYAIVITKKEMQKLETLLTLHKEDVIIDEYKININDEIAVRVVADD